MRKTLITLSALSLIALASCGGTSIGGASSEASSSSSEIAYQYGEKEMYEKIWDTKIVHNENLCLRELDDGIYGELLYLPTRIISVRDYSLNTIYEEGKDFTVEGRKIVRTATSPIPYYTKDNLTCAVLPEEYAISSMNANADGTKKILFTEGSGIVMHLLAVTYEHEDAWPSSFVPAYQGDKLPNTMAKLNEGGDFSLVFFGDSIMTGCNSTGKLGIEPYQEIYPDAVTKLLGAKFPKATINMTNSSVGGWLSRDGWSNIDNGVNALSPDLVFLGFGMNDGAWEISTDDYCDNIDMMIRSIKAKTPTAEIVVVSTILPNPESIQSKSQEAYLAPLKEVVSNYDGVILMDMTSLSKPLVEKKNGLDLFANNINHPNDFLVRQYVSTIMTTLDEDYLK